MSASEDRANLFGIVTIVLTLLGWSSVPLFLRHFAESIDAWTSNGWRYGFAALIWAPVLIVGAYRRRLPRGLFVAALVPALINATGQVCFTTAHYRIDPGLLTFGLRSQLIFVAIGAFMLFPAERPIIRSGGYLIGLVALMAGTAATILLGHNPFEEAYLAGVTLAVVSGLCFAGYGLAVRRFMHGVNPVLAFAAISQYTALAMVVLMIVLGRNQGLEAPRLETSQFVLLLVSSVVGIAIGHVFYYTSLARLGVAVSAGVLQLQPFIVAIGSLMLFRERLTIGQWVGGCVAVGGALLMLAVQRRISRRQRIAQTPLALAEGESGS